MRDEASFLEYIKIQWTDIHHNRLQEWTVLSVIAGTIFLMVQGNNLSLSPDLRLFLSVFGVLSSFLGVCICWQHYKIFIQKMWIIADCEKVLGIEYPKRNDLFSVQIFMFLLFATINSGFVGLVLYNLEVDPDKITGLKFIVYLVGFETFFSFLIFALARRKNLQKPIIFLLGFVIDILAIVFVYKVTKSSELIPPFLMQHFYITLGCLVPPLIPFVSGMFIKSFYKEKKEFSLSKLFNTVKKKIDAVDIDGVIGLRAFNDAVGGIITGFSEIGVAAENVDSQGEVFVAEFKKLKIYIENRISKISKLKDEKTEKPN